MGKTGVNINLESSEKKNINDEEDSPMQEDTSFDEDKKESKYYINRYSLDNIITNNKVEESIT